MVRAERITDKFQQLDEFRNRLVHLYGEIDDTYVYEFIKKDLKDVLDFKAVIVAKYLAPQDRNDSATS